MEFLKGAPVLTVMVFSQFQMHLKFGRLFYRVSAASFSRKLSSACTAAVESLKTLLTWPPRSVRFPHNSAVKTKNDRESLGAPSTNEPSFRESFHVIPDKEQRFQIFCLGGILFSGAGQRKRKGKFF